MTRYELQRWLLDEGVRADIASVTRATIVTDLGGIVLSPTAEAPVDPLDWERLLLAGSILAQSSDREFAEAALRIATAAITLETTSRIKDAGAILFEQLANHRSVRLAEHRELLLPDLQGRLGVTARLDAARRVFEHSVLIRATGEWMSVNDFQRQFWSEANEPATWISASAPTASGKTFLVLRWLVEQLQITDARVVGYIAPTRALVSEIEGSLRASLSARNIEGIEVTSLPLKEKFLGADSGKHKVIYVLTQERLQLLSRVIGSALKFQLLIVDEAHKIGDRGRGVVLQDAIERVVRSNAVARVVFISPATQNPEILLEDAPESTPQKTINSDTPTVVQNLLTASQVPRKPKQWRIDALVRGESLPIGHLTLQNRPTSLKKKLAFIAASLSTTGGTLVYANGAADAEGIADLIYQLLPAPPTIDEELLALADLARKGVHEKYQLAVVVQRGVAFHYGNMPSLLRTEIERLFRSGKIRFLVCTSTLVDGVNLSCRTIVLRGPQKGRGKPMEVHDFWNLAGRAGRWGHEFQGNIICIDPADKTAWPHGVPERSRYPIRRETDAIITQNASLIDFIERRAELSEQELSSRYQHEQVMAYLLAMYLREGTVLGAPFTRRHDPASIQKIEAALSKVGRIAVPLQIVNDHSGVNAVGLQKLLVDLRAYAGDVEDLLPAPPESDDAYTRMTSIMRRINNTLYPIFLPDSLVPLHTLVVLEWLKGFSVARIIDARIRYHRRHSQTVALPKLFRETMELVEQTARFRAPKYISAYVDVVRHHLQEIGRYDLLDDELDVGVALEFGVSTRTLVSLMELGLSRMSAVLLYEKIARDDLDHDGCRAWVAERADTLEALELPVIVVREVKMKLIGVQS